MGKVDAGSLRERVTILTTAEPVKDAGGYGYKPGGPDVAQTVWARVRPLRTYERQQLGQTINSAAYEVTVRRVEGLATGKQRIRWQGETLNIQGVTQDETREFQLLTCFNSGK